MTQTTQKDTPGCNTKSRAWCFTINNYKPEDIEKTKEFLSSGEYVFGEEMGDTKNTPHLQGVVRWTNAKTFNSMKKILPRAHLEPCKNWKGSKVYCKKDNKYHTNIIELTCTAEDQYKEYIEKKYKNVKWKKWQQTILDIIEQEPSERKIYWFYEEDGNVGKSFLSKWLDWKYNAIIANGKQSDVYNQYAKFLEEYDTQPTLAIIDIPRSHKEYVCYSTMEKIKDGLVYSGKYEGKKLRLIPHHLIVFANFEPDRTKLSEDRWMVNYLEDE